MHHSLPVTMAVATNLIRAIVEIDNQVSPEVQLCLTRTPF